MQVRWRATFLFALGALGSAPASAQFFDPTPVFGCSAAQRSSCEDIEGGRAISVSSPPCTGWSCPPPIGPSCVCEILVSSPPRVVNARRGDVGLVPRDGGGDPTVDAVMGALGQWHRHAVMYSDDGRHVTHATTYWKAWLGTFNVAHMRLNAFDLEHAAPNRRETPEFPRGQDLRQALSESWGWRPHSLCDPTNPRECSRLARRGLVLKPATEAERGSFQRALARAESVYESYYRISDYTILDGMGFPPRSGAQRRGTHCAGLVHFAFSPEYPGFMPIRYGAGIRGQAGVAIFDVIHARAPAPFRNRIANQVANCFSGRCNDTSDKWRTNPGVGLTVSPDNLLPERFFVSSPVRSTTFNGGGNRYDVDPVDLGEDFVEQTGDRVFNPNGNPTSPFQRVEPQVFANASVSRVRLWRW